MSFRNLFSSAVTALGHGVESATRKLDAFNENMDRSSKLVVLRALHEKKTALEKLIAEYEELGADAESLEGELEIVELQLKAHL